MAVAASLVVGSEGSIAPEVEGMVPCLHLNPKAINIKSNINILLIFIEIILFDIRKKRTISCKFSNEVFFQISILFHGWTLFPLILNGKSFRRGQKSINAEKRRISTPLILRDK
jgi:hypothetical protein